MNIALTTSPAHKSGFARKLPNWIACHGSAMKDETCKLSEISKVAFAASAASRIGSTVLTKNASKNNLVPNIQFSSIGNIMIGNAASKSGIRFAKADTNRNHPRKGASQSDSDNMPTKVAAHRLTRDAGAHIR